ncbi:MAG: hypothetical protein WC838_08005 [Candidatus Margulisiibacteriota bacterium]|jgi:hypothetical protein
MKISSLLFALLGIMGILAGILNKRGGHVPEVYDLMFYSIGLTALIAAILLYYFSTKLKTE